MLAQRLRHRVTIQSSAPRLTAGGERVGDQWADLHIDLPAEMVPLSGRELLAANAEHASVTVRCTIRVVDGAQPTSAMRLIHLGMAYNIVAVIPDPSYTTHLTLLLEAGVRYEEGSSVA